ncbi:MAG: MBOAT family protein [Planctomycetes bacterium]|nr:MBOAT family protein [Planctomycetota bacterium]
MLFNSLEFFVFFAVVWGLYLCLRHRAQNRLLLVASYVFYGAWDWRFLGLLLLSTLIDFYVARGIGRTESQARKKTLVTVSLVANLGILAFFKYAAFFAGSLQDLLQSFGYSLPPAIWSVVSEVVLPVGISFYTFQTLSYSIDVYRGQMKPAEKLEDFALFVAFFPQLVAGPIERATRLLPQIESPRKVTWEGLNAGAWLVLQGTFKKVVVADNLAFVVESVFRQGHQNTAWEIMLGSWAFAWQMYGDFSGYSDVARGVSRMMGFELMLNFNLPFISTSPSDFWRRWHISLSTWLRDYLFFPLGGSRKGLARTYFNLWFTMVISGLWHGASWNMVVWGAYMGLAMALHRMLLPVLEKIAFQTQPMRALWWAFRATVNFQIFAIGWIIFVPATIGVTGDMLSTLLRFPWDVGMAGQWVQPFLLLVSPLLVMHALQVRARDLECVLRWPLLLRGATYAAVFLTIVLMGEDFGLPFFYFQF